MMENFIDLFEDCTSQGTKIKTDEYCETGKYIIVDQGQSDIAGYTDEVHGVYEDVPAIVFGDHTRVIKYIDKPFFLGADGVKLLKCKKENANYKYLYYALKNAQIPNTGYNRHYKWLKEIKIMYPDSLQQQKIVEVLDKIERILVYRKKQIDTLDTLIKARFVELFGDPLINPMGWPVKTIKDVACLNKGITYSPENVVDQGMIVLRSSNIKGNVFDLQDIVKISKKVSPEKYVQENDILMCNRNGSAQLVGKVAKIPNLEEKMTFGTFMTIVRSDIYDYLFVFFQLEAFREQIKFQTAVAINQISLPLLASVKVPIPSKELLDRFADFVKKVDKSKFEVQKALEETQILMDSLMQEYFG